METSETELRCLDSDIIDVEGGGIDFLHFLAEHDAGGGVDEILFENLADEGEGARCAQITFDNLHVVVFCKILDVERPRDIELFSNAGRDAFDPACGGHVYFLGREHESGVA